MKKLFSTILFLCLVLTGNAYSKDTPYMKLLNSYEGVDRMLVCTPLMQKVSDVFRDGIQSLIEVDNTDVQEFLDKSDNLPSKFRAFDSRLTAYRNAISLRMVGEYWIAGLMPEEEKAKKAYQKNHIVNEAVILVSKLSYKDLGPYISRCTDSFIQLKKENSTVRKYDELLHEKAIEEVRNLLLKQIAKKTVKKQNTSSKNIIHLACYINESFGYDANYKEEKIERDSKTITWSFHLDKQILLDTNFKNNPPLKQIFASIDENYIRWHLGDGPDDESKSNLKEEFGELILFKLMDIKINRYSGKVIMNMYGLDSANFLYMVGSKVVGSEIENIKLEFNSPEGLKHRIQYLNYALLNLESNKIQKEFIHIAKQTGDCKATTKTKQF